MEPLQIVSEITINAPADKVWDALVNPEQTKKYMYGCETVSDWKPGSPLLWRMEHEGSELIAVKGEVVAIEPGEYLEYTVIDPNNKIYPTSRRITLPLPIRLRRKIAIPGLP